MRNAGKTRAQKRPFISTNKSTKTAACRGYYGTWEIRVVLVNSQPALEIDLGETFIKDTSQIHNFFTT